ncbi:MAG TPA: uroporphyrinogen decarboxylase [Anaerolineales bacterium]|nr:uroporphyrinogen decarboxylase [Anaerolineales bacterium]
MKKPLLEILKGNAPSRRPVWLMRQAGRYLPEYMEVRSQAGGFLELCYTPEFACEVTLQPLRRFDFDAAILFADILLVPQAMGCDLEFLVNEGPSLRKIRSDKDVAGLAWDISTLNKTLSPVYESVSLIRANLDAEKTLIGFCGAPWTVATYMIEGGTSTERAMSRLAAFANESWLNELIDKLVYSSVEYLSAQVRAGAEVLQIFDTWAGDLSGNLLTRYCFDPISRMRAELKIRHPDVPVIGFARGIGVSQTDFVDATGVDGVSIEWPVNTRWARDNLCPRCVVQGNLDPLSLIGGGEGMLDAARQILTDFPMNRHIFNLGHGIRKETSPEHVSDLVDFIRSHDGR